MSEPRVPKEGSVPSVSQGGRRAATPASQPYPLVNRIALGIVLALLAIGLPIGCVMWGIDPDPRNFVAASTTNYARFYIDSVSCVSVDRLRYDSKEFFDPKLPDAAADILGIKTVLFNADYEACPWALFMDINPVLNLTGVGYFTRYKIHVGICARSADGKGTDKCIYKIIHVFTPRVQPHDLVRIALAGLAQPQFHKADLLLVKR